MDLHCLAKKLLERIMTHIKKTENIEQLNVAGHAILEVQDLKDDLIGSKEIAEKMIEGINESVELNIEEISRIERKVSKAEEEIRSLEEKIRILNEDEEDNQKRVARLEGEVFGKDGQIAHLNKKVERHEIKLKKIESALYTGQIAFDFEKDLATYVYPHDKKFGSRKIFTNMKKWLEEKKDTLQGSKANEKWNALQSEFLWSSEHERVFFKLLESRKQFAHPIVDRDAVQWQISDDFTDEEKMRVKDIVNIIERVNELMQ
ncbi:Hypothetical predicted protein [Paramuricea clavata]|uniref:Uncharacterized protein n=1 Tax=Paramuricea clavata TaxID=317549 RepID=A0A6S7J6X6_PARCT|nr:Hypothetical predicted protein [Paramuricea clavata]